MIKAAAAGDTGVLIDTDGSPAWLAAAIIRARLPGVIDVVPGARTVLVLTSPRSRSLDELASDITALPVAEPPAGPQDLVEIPVTYDGPDLADVASLAGPAGERGDRKACGCCVHGGVARVRAGVRLPDRARPAAGQGASPRLAPAFSSGRLSRDRRRALGCVSIGFPGRLAADRPHDNENVGHQPRASRAPGPRPASQVQADPDWGPREPAKGDGEVRSQAGPGGDWRGTQAPRRLEVLRTGPLATVQDLGRPGFGASGVPPSGAADRVSLIAANRLAGNDDAAAGVELTLGRAAFLCFGELTLAVTGAPAEVTLTASPQGRPRRVPFGESFVVPDGAVVTIGAPAAGLRTYVAAGGGLAVPAQLGSRSADLLSGLGGGPLRAGAVLPVGPAGSGWPGAGAAGDGLGPAAGTGTAVVGRGEVARLRVVAGPRLDWFGAEALDVLCGSDYTVTAASNRTGMRLDGPSLRPRAAELPSEGLVTGSLQVPGNGLPILLLADHHTVGGYPVIAVVASADLGLAAQLRPGSADQVSAADAPLSRFDVGGGDRGEVGRAGEITKLGDPEVARGAGPLVQRSRVPAVAELVDPALVAGFGEDPREHRDGVRGEQVSGPLGEDYGDPHQLFWLIAGEGDPDAEPGGQTRVRAQESAHVIGVTG